MEMVKKQCLWSSLDKVKVDEERDWSTLPDDIVAQIGELLLADDVLSYIPLRGVCSSWRQATENPAITDRRFCPRSWIFMWGSDESDKQVLRSKPRHLGSDESDKQVLSRKPRRRLGSGGYDKQVLSIKSRHRFLNTTNGKYLLARIPELRNQTVNACLEGLLFITGRCSDRVTSRLLNPFTGSTLEYPDISQLYSSRCELEMRQQSLSFVDSSSSAILVIGLEFMAYAKPGYKEWKVISQGMNHHHCHLFFQGSPYSFSCRGDLVRFELDEEPKGHVEFRTKTLIGADLTCYYLVESDGEMLAVIWSRFSEHFSFFRIFKVVKHEKQVKGDVDKVSLVPTMNIGKRALFIHPWHRCISISVSTDDVSSCILPNSIYFYEEWNSPPKIYRKSLSSCYELVEEQFLPSRFFSPFPVSASTRKGRTITLWWSCC